jgi:hypothetical protein
MAVTDITRVPVLPITIKEIPAAVALNSVGFNISPAIGGLVAESWIEHLRQHERVTIADHDILEQAIAFHTGNKPPIVSHFIAEPLTQYSKEE